MLRSVRSLAVLGLLALLALSACSGASAVADAGNDTGNEVATLDESPAPGAGDGTDADASPAASIDPEEALLAYAACMREHGVDMPDPQFSGSTGGGPVQFGVRIGGSAAAGEDGETGPDGAEMPDLEDLEAAQEACQEHIAGLVGPDGPRGEMSPEEQEQFLAFAKCMREHGVDMPDPQFGNGGGMVMIGGPSASGEPMEMPDQETLEAAHEACQGELPGGGDGSAPGFRISGGDGGDGRASTDASTDEAQP